MSKFQIPNIELIVWLLSAILLAIMILHLIWALRIWWPISDEKQLARSVVGAKNIEKMPAPHACMFVVIALAFVLYFVLSVAGIATFPLPNILLFIFIAGVALVFLLRGLIAYTKFWQRLTPEMPFSMLDRKYYAPLCLLIGSGLAILAIESLREINV